MNGFDFIHSVVFLEQALTLHLEISQGEGHNRWLNGHRLLLSVISEYNKFVCNVVLNSVFVLHKCDNAIMWWINVIFNWYEIFA